MPIFDEMRHKLVYDKQTKKTEQTPWLLARKRTIPTKIAAGQRILVRTFLD
jgi:hypothetical protein